MITRSTQKDFLRSQSVIKKRRKKRMVRLGVRLALLSALLVSVALLSQIDFFSIKKIIISGNSNIETEKIQEIVDSAIHTSYLGLFPKTNVFLYPKSNILDSLTAQFPRIRALKVYTESFNTLNVRIEERTPAVVWCSAIQCYLVDDSAYIYAEQPRVTSALDSAQSSRQEGSGLLLLEGLDEQIGSSPVGKKVLQQESFTKILQVVNQMKPMHLDVHDVEFRSADEVNFWIHAGTSTTDRKKIIFSARKDYQSAFDNLTAALKSNALSSNTDFEYIDTRFGNKVFYRLVPTKASTTTSKKKV